MAVVMVMRVMVSENHEVLTVSQEKRPRTGAASSEYLVRRAYLVTAAAFSTASHGSVVRPK